MIKNFFKTFLLFELVKGMALTGRYFFARKITVQFRKRKLHRVSVSVVCMPCAAIRMGKSVV